MKTQEWKFDDYKAFPPGPWNEEPDKVQFTDEETGLPCLVVRNTLGNLCGYVGVAEGHRYFGVGYSQCSQKPPCEESWCGHSPEALVDVHGGLTYADFCQDGGKVCHVVEPGENSVIWWLGFDAAHLNDLTPSLLRYEKPMADEVYKNVDYVKDECANLAAQLANIK